MGNYTCETIIKLKEKKYCNVQILNSLKLSLITYCLIPYIYIYVCIPLQKICNSKTKLALSIAYKTIKFLKMQNKIKA